MLSAELLCGTKRKYGNVKEARDAALKIMGKDSGAPIMYIYKCPDCGQRHITASKGGAQKKEKIVVRRKRWGVTSHHKKERRSKKLNRKQRLEKGCKLWQNSRE